MKKALALILILALILPVLLLPAAAAEPVFYDFEFVSSFMLLDDSYDFEGGGNLGEGMLFFDSPILLPEGQYRIYLYDNQGNIVFDFGTALVSFSEGDAWPDSSLGSFEYGDFLVYDFYIDLTDLGTTEVYVGFASGYPDCSCLRFVSVDSSDAVASDLSTFLGSIRTGLTDLTGTTLSTIVLGGLGVCAAPVLVWFGYRFIKGKAVKAFKKGKV